MANCHLFAGAIQLFALAIGWSLQKRQITSYFLAGALLVPRIAFSWNAIHQILSPEIPEGAGMSRGGNPHLSKRDSRFSDWNHNLHDEC